MKRALITISVFSVAGLVGYLMAIGPLQAFVYGVVLILCDRAARELS